MAKTIYSTQSVESIVSDIRSSFSHLGINIASFRVVPTGTENRFTLLRQSPDGTQLATEISGSALRRLKESLFDSGSLGLLCGSRSNSEQAFAYAQRLADEEEKERERLAEEQAVREAERADREERDAIMSGAAQAAARADILNMLKNMSPEERTAYFDAADV